MNLLKKVAATLKEADIAFVVIGAAAMAVHGVSRSTLDIDLLAIDGRVLQSQTWTPLSHQSISLEIRFGDVQDPLRGVVRFEADGQRPIDLIVGCGGWQTIILSRPAKGFVGGIELPVAGKPDLVLLKLYAGGPQDLWDIRQLLDTDPSGAVQAEVDKALVGLPQSMHKAWNQVLQR